MERETQKDNRIKEKNCVAEKGETKRSETKTRKKKGRFFFCTVQCDRLETLAFLCYAGRLHTLYYK